MNRDEARKILGEGATEEQITNLLNNYHVTESEKVKSLEAKLTDLEAKSSKYSDYDEIKKQLDDINRANMSEQEKLEEQKKEIEKNLKDSRIIVNNAKAKEILAEFDLDDDTVSLVVSDDENATITRANNLKNKLISMKESVAKQTKEKLTNLDVTPSISNVNQEEKDAMNLDKFLNLSAEDQNKFMQEHPQEYENLK